MAVASDETRGGVLRRRLGWRRLHRLCAAGSGAAHGGVCGVLLQHGHGRDAERGSQVGRGLPGGRRRQRRRRGAPAVVFRRGHRAHGAARPHGRLRGHPAAGRRLVRHGGAHGGCAGGVPQQRLHAPPRSDGRAGEHRSLADRRPGRRPLHLLRHVVAAHSGPLLHRPADRGARRRWSQARGQVLRQGEQVARQRRRYGERVAVAPPHGCRVWARRGSRGAVLGRARAAVLQRYPQGRGGGSGRRRGGRLHPLWRRLPVLRWWPLLRGRHCGFCADHALLARAHLHRVWHGEREPRRRRQGGGHARRAPRACAGHYALKDRHARDATRRPGGSARARAGGAAGRALRLPRARRRERVPRAEPEHRGGHDRRAGGPLRLRQEHDGRSAPALLRRRRRRGAPRRRRHPLRRRALAAAANGSRLAGAGALRRQHRLEHRAWPAGRVERGDRGGGAACKRAHVCARAA
mmetsp:Transcript_36866/g.86114  ORF Transcript_36866/g.86114 Transcript_36866/m.86114 type:complete len:464 (+) Transcript_36866:1794-3185(+)